MAKFRKLLGNCYYRNTDHRVLSSTVALLFGPLYHGRSHRTELVPSQTDWFQACRNLPADGVFPDTKELPMDFAMTAQAFLNGEAGPEIPKPPAEPTEKDRYLTQLIEIKQALDEEDLVRGPRG